MPKDKKDEREKPLLTKGKRHKVVRFLISPKKKKINRRLERERVLESEGNKFLEPTIFSPLKIIPEKIAITAPKERTK